ncbi:response regulator [Candidatus Formimonas warabiya]|uniref:Stage 0 sporulation protein A homolog n=1 Tax=Formimonas warabiya TaxID=1761012 RepID=A0A3G1KVB0_FORW1|nr:response regulator [Candidatus Formimonas warabiya]ATW26145.1 hypothetical protein DCMF_16425 [Candidatus Formimonas warabiya]
MNILIVDDEADSLKEIEAHIHKFGSFDFCVTCSNALEALERAKKCSFDMALLDIEMPVMNGLELAERLSQISPHMGIIFITAYNHYATESFEVNAVDYVLKPVREERLFKALTKFMAKKQEKNGIEDKDKRLYIHMFGKFTVHRGNELLAWNRQKSTELFAYLLENKGCPLHKEKLCDLLWPDVAPKKALMNLQTAMYSIRKTFGAAEKEQLEIKYAVNKYTLTLKDAVIDVDQFESLMQKARDSKDITYMEQAIKLYTGDYLEEEGWLWAEPQKLLLRKKYLTALQKIKGKNLS